MKITHLDFTDAEWAAVEKRAARSLRRKGKDAPEGSETPQNVLRLALGFETRKRGGARPGGIEQAITAAVEEEREACEKIPQDIIGKLKPGAFGAEYIRSTALEIRDRIRARGGKK